MVKIISNQWDHRVAAARSTICTVRPINNIERLISYLGFPTSIIKTYWSVKIVYQIKNNLFLRFYLHMFVYD